MNFSRYTMHKIPNIVMKHTVYAVGCAHVLPFCIWDLINREKFK